MGGAGGRRGAQGLGAVAAAMAMATATMITTMTMSGVARADSPAVLLESHVGKRPDDAEHLIGTLARTLERPVLHGRELSRQVESRMSRAAASQSPLVGVRSQVEDGRRQFIEGRFKEAAKLLEKARKRMMAQVAHVAADQTLRDLLHRALMFLTHAYLRGGRTDEAIALVSEVVRSFPDRDLSLVTHGPDLASFYRKVRRDLDRQPRGQLTVDAGVKGSMVFVNERFVGVSPARVVDLYPGVYRVYVQQGGQHGRIHLVRVEGKEQRVHVPFSLDRMLHTGETCQLIYRDAKSRRRLEARHAAEVARALEAPLALVLGFHRSEGRRALRGTAVSGSSGRVIRSGMVLLEPAEPAVETLLALGQFLVAGKPSDRVIMRAGGPLAGTGTGAGAGPAASKTDADSGGVGAVGVLKWVLGGLSVAALGAGIPLLAIHGQPTCGEETTGKCPTDYDTAAAGATLVAVGGAAAITSVILFVVDARSDSKSGSSAAVIAPWAGPSSAGVGAVVTF